MSCWCVTWVFPSLRSDCSFLIRTTLFINDLPLAISYLAVAQAFNNNYSKKDFLLWLNALGLVRYNKCLISSHLIMLKPYFMVASSDRHC